MKTNNSLNFAVATLLTDLSGNVPSEIQLTLDGTFKAKDGRPAGLSGWVLDEKIAQNVVQLANAQRDAFVIDYEHQTLYAKQNGMPAPAAGWFKNLQYREGLGLFATQVEWTDSAALAIQNKEYRYISPVIAYDPKTGAVTKVLMAALVNNPALDGMKDLTALNYYLSQQETQMTDAEKIKELGAKVTDLEKQLSDSKAACATAEDKAKKAACANEAGTVDLSQYVPMDDFKTTQAQLIALSAQVQEKEISEVIEAALSDGRLLPAQKELAQKMGKKDLASLKEFLGGMQKVEGLSNTQTGGKAPEGGDKKGEKNANEIAALATAYQTQQTALGYQIDDIAAVNHVMSEWVKNV